MRIKITPEGMVLYLTKKHTTVRLETPEEIKQVFPDFDSKADIFPKDYPSPEIVHLEISDQCNLKCPYCYVGEKSAQEIDTAAWKNIIDKLNRANVFQVTFGGGEPTMRDDLIELAQYAKSVGLNVAMTTNGINLPAYSPEELDVFDQINVSYHHTAGKKVFDIALMWLEYCDIGRGINYCLSKEYASDLDYIVKTAEKYHAELLVLTYKPVIGNDDNQIPPEEVLKTMKDVKSKGINIYVDGLTCQTCLGSKRFCDVSSVGDIYPCSFIRESQGNLLKTPFDVIWKSRKKEVTCPYLKS